MGAREIGDAASHLLDNLVLWDGKIGVGTLAKGEKLLRIGSFGEPQSPMS